MIAQDGQSISLIEFLANIAKVEQRNYLLGLEVEEQRRGKGQRQNARESDRGVMLRQPTPGGVGR